MTFTSRQVIAISQLSQRQLTYWRRTALVIPSGHSPGGHARYSFTDLIIIRTIKQLIDAGVSIQRIRKSITCLRQFLPTLQRPLTELTLVATGDIILVLHEDSAFEAISGQEWIFPIAQLLRGHPQHDPHHGNKQQPLFDDKDISNHSTKKAVNQ
jgi:DNA-binding transcriptional MerR regulator